MGEMRIFEKGNTMFTETDHLNFLRTGVMPQRSYYIPFAIEDKFSFKHRILDRTKSSLFITLDGIWQFKNYERIEDVDINAELDEEIPVPSSVQFHGYDRLQYLNERYPIFYDPPYIPAKTPAFHYRRAFNTGNLSRNYYLNFEGVDSGFYLYINKRKVGYGQISHCTNEFDVTSFLIPGENIIDVIVLKWCAGTYLECQDKFRLSGIFRSVYLLKREKRHLTDYKINTYLENENGVIEVVNKSDASFKCVLKNKVYFVGAGGGVKIIVKNVKVWSAENPYLYSLTIFCENEKILNRIGVRTVEIDDGVFKINKKHVKLKGVNRHEFNCERGAVVTLEDTVKDLKLIKKMNANSIRTAHYPDIPEFYDLCDVYGFYIIDEADLETHGTFNVENSLGYEVMREEACRGIFDDAVLDREIALMERDKNRTSVVVWSIGNESSFGPMFYKGIEYIKANDSRPIHYQGVFMLEGNDEYYTDKIDILGCFYPELSFFDKYLRDEKEKRPLLLSEYLHAMGNSCGGLKDYWEIINSNDRFSGALVWEFNDHAVKTEKGFLYGGDFGESEHDLNFCVDGLVSPDRKIKSNYLEVQSMYQDLKGKEIFNPTCVFREVSRLKPVSISVTESGCLSSIGNVKLKEPMRLNILRAYTDNDGRIKPEWSKYENYDMQTYSVETDGGKTIFTGKIVVNTLKPLMDYIIIYDPFDGGVDVTLKYKVAPFVTYLPRIGFEFAVDKKYGDFSYKGYGKNESYIDKYLASNYGEFFSTANKNYSNYIMPQECGSHFNSTELDIRKLMKITAEKPFSFSVLPYSTETLLKARHSFELKKSNSVFVNLDVAMSGVGTASCGPALPEKCRAPKEGQNTFRIYLSEFVVDNGSTL